MLDETRQLTLCLIMACRAGWGGCVVSLIPSSQEKAFINAVIDPKTGYSKYRGKTAEELKTSVFKTVPGSGAGGELSIGHWLRPSGADSPLFAQ